MSFLGGQAGKRGNFLARKRADLGDNQPWFNVVPATGDNPGEVDLPEIHFYTEELALGMYTGQMTTASAEATNSPKIVNVVLDVHETTLVCDTTTLSFSVVISNNPPSQVMNVGSYSTSSPLNYTITSDSVWLSTSPTNGSSNGEFDEIIVSVDSSSLAEGNYEGLLTVHSPGSVNAPHNIAVQLEVHRPYVYLDSLYEMTDWETPAESEFAWTVNSGSTPSSFTGPSGAAKGGYYMYTEASYENNPYRTALLEKTFSFNGIAEPELSFVYHMYGAAMGDLAVDVFDGTWHSNLWHISGQ